MTLAGTRPILQDELLKYELHHRARIAIKPGITGMKYDYLVVGSGLYGAIFAHEAKAHGKSKSLAWSSIVLALGNIKEEVVDRPKALGDIRGVTYIYGMFYQFGLIDVPDKVKEKMGRPINRKK